MDSTEKLAAFILSLPDMVCSIDSDNIILSVNSAVSNFGYEREEMIGKSILDYIHSDSIDAFKNRGASEISVLFSAKEMTKNEVTVKFVPVKIYGSDSAFVLVKDMREFKAQEDALKMTKNQLFQSEKMASIGHLAAGVAHEINNPLGFVSSNMATLQTYIDPMGKLLGMVEELNSSLNKGDWDAVKAKGKEIESLAKEKDIEFILEDLNDLIEESLQGLDRIKKIVMDLKLYARKESDEKGEADINAIIDSAINIVWNQLKYKCDVKKDFSKLPMVECNVQQMTQVFVNLLVNASQAIVDKGIIQIKSYSDGSNVLVDVTDSGKGMTESIMARIFDPLFTTKEPGKGTGLGLSITYEILKKHDGNIEVSSQVGEGTTFIITLPAAGQS